MTSILVVDDSATHCQRAADILSRHGFDVLTAQDAEEGIELAHAQRPALILMDVVMPGCNGFEATRRLAEHEATAAIPVVLLSAKDKQLDRHWGLRQGAKAYLTKPIQEPQLIQTLRQVLGLAAGRVA